MNGNWVLKDIQTMHAILNPVLSRILPRFGRHVHKIFTGRVERIKF